MTSIDQQIADLNQQFKDGMWTRKEYVRKLSELKAQK